MAAASSAWGWGARDITPASALRKQRQLRREKHHRSWYSTDSAI